MPILLGEGIRFFDNLTDPPVMFENPTIIEGDRVTHLIYRRSGEPRSTVSVEELPVGW